MKAKRLAVIFAVLLAWAAPALAAQDEAAQQKMQQLQQRLQEYKERLNLTPEQVEQVRPVMVEELQQFKAVRDKYAGNQSRRSRFKMVRDLRDIRHATDQKLEKILSKEQMAELQKIREEQRHQFRERGA
jgi:hypothetical protein